MSGLIRGQKAIILIFGIGFIFGCVTVQERPYSAGSSIGEKAVAVVNRDPQQIYFMTYEEFMAVQTASLAFGVAGAAISGTGALARVNERLKKYNIPDPGKELRQVFIRDFSSIYGTETEELNKTFSASGNFGEIVMNNKGVIHLYLDVKIDEWGITFYQNAPDRYYYLQKLRVLLIDEGNFEIARGICDYRPEFLKTPGTYPDMDGNVSEEPVLKEKMAIEERYYEAQPTYDEWLADNAKLIHEEINRANRECRAHILENIFQPPPQSL